MIKSHDKQIAIAKVAFVGPGGSGKSTILDIINSKVPQSNRGEIAKIDSHGSTLISLEISPQNIKPILGKSLQFRLVASTGKVSSPASWQILLEDVDAIVFVASSRVSMMVENVKALNELEENLQALNVSPISLPFIYLYNKRDAERQYTIDELNAKINRRNAPYFETVAIRGYGIFQALKLIIETANNAVKKQLEKYDPNEKRDLEHSKTISEENGSNNKESVFTFQASSLKESDTIGSDNKEKESTDANRTNTGGLLRRLGKRLSSK